MSTDTTLSEVAEMIETVLDGYELDGPITRETAFQRDLAFASIDLVVLSGHVHEKYGELVNLPRHLSEMDLDEIVALTVGDLADYIDHCRAA
ncbi:acyl carrier protein [Amycolatopsis speibonae]|uniref:Acyl carrier protein n=1 Tax=Amycolatopsis speibonae TaxID=1450224 RepID=A0ABV7P2M5_9PSEU